MITATGTAPSYLQRISEYRRALDASSIFVITDNRGEISYVNDNFCILSKYPREELLGKTFRLLNSGYHSHAFFAQLWETISTGHIWKGEIRNKKKDGAIFWADVVIIPFLNKNKVPHQYVAIFTESTSTKEDLDFQFRLLFHQNRDGIVLSTPDGRFLDVNDAFLNMLGYTKEEFMRLSRVDITVKEDPDLEPALKMRQESGHYNGPLQFRRKDGSIISCELSSSQLENENGEKRTFVMARDITEKLNAEKALRDGEARLRALVEHGKDIITLVNADGSLRFRSDSFHQLMGYSPDQLKPYLDFSNIHPDDADALKATFKQLLEKKGSRFKNRWRQLHGDGSWRWMEGTGVNMLDVPSVNGIVCNYRDITEHIEAGLNLEQKNKELSYLFDRIEEVLYSANRNPFKLTQMSAACEKLYGYKAEAFFANEMLWFDLILPEDKKVIKEINTELSAGRAAIGQYRIRHRNGEVRWIEAHLTPSLDEQGNLYRVDGVNRDITLRKKAEQELERLNNSLEVRIRERTLQLEESNKALESFAYLAAHDLQSPLRALSGFTNILQTDFADKLGEEGRQLLDVVMEKSIEMSQLVSNLLNFCRISHAIFIRSNVNLDALVQEVLHDLPEAGPAGNTEIISGALGTCFCDANLTKQVWVNLISNALKYSSKKEKPRIETGFFDKEGQKTYFVRDNGAGFDMAQAHKLFSPFQRLHSSSEYPGTGVGLASAANIIKRHNGRIWAESEPGQGATFYFTIPG